MMTIALFLAPRGGGGGGGQLPGRNRCETLRCGSSWRATRKPALWRLKHTRTVLRIKVGVERSPPLLLCPYGTLLRRGAASRCAAMRGVGALADRGFARAAAAGLASVAALAAAGVLIDGAWVMMTPARGQPAASTGQRAPFREKLHQTASQTAANSNRNRGAKPAQRSDSGII